jgi:hypothetical protein
MIEYSSPMRDILPDRARELFDVALKFTTAPNMNDEMERARLVLAHGP